MARPSQLSKCKRLVALTTVTFLLARCALADVADLWYDMGNHEDCWGGLLSVPRGQTTHVVCSETNQVTRCRLQFTPQTAGDVLTLEVLDFDPFYNSYLHWVWSNETSLIVKMDNQSKTLNIFSSRADLPKFQARNGIATVDFSPGDTEEYSYCNIKIAVPRSNPEIDDPEIDEQDDGPRKTNFEVWVFVGIITGSLASIVIFLVFVCCLLGSNSRQRRARQRRGVQHLWNQEAGVHVNQQAGVHVNQQAGVHVNQQAGVHVNQEAGVHVNQQSLGNSQNISVFTLNPSLNDQIIVCPPPYPGLDIPTKVKDDEAAVPSDLPPPYE